MDIFHFLFLVIGVGLGMTAIWLILTKQELKDFDSLKENMKNMEKRLSRISELDDLKKQIGSADKKIDALIHELKTDLEAAHTRIKDTVQKHSEKLEQTQADIEELSNNFKALKKPLEEKKTEKPANSNYTKCPCIHISDKPDKKDHTACWSPLLTGVR